MIEIFVTDFVFHFFQRFCLLCSKLKEKRFKSHKVIPFFYRLILNIDHLLHLSTRSFTSHHGTPPFILGLHPSSWDSTPHPGTPPLIPVLHLSSWESTPHPGTPPLIPVLHLSSWESTPHPGTSPVILGLHPSFWDSTPHSGTPPLILRLHPCPRTPHLIHAHCFFFWIIEDFSSGTCF